MTNFQTLRPLVPIGLETPTPTPPQPPPTPPAASPRRPVPEASHRLREAIHTLGWTYGGLAARLGLSHSTIRNYGKGISQPPAVLLDWIEALARHHADHPPPAVRLRQGNPDWTQTQNGRDTATTGAGASVSRDKG